MTYSRIEKEGIDIRQYPSEAMAATAEITLGDLHGNALKLLHFLIMQGVVRFKASVKNPEAIYQRFVQHYDAIAVQEVLYRKPHLLVGQEKHTLIMEKTQASDPTQKAALEEKIKNIDEAVKIAETPEAKEKARKILVEHSAAFISLMDSLEVLSSNTLVRLIGDEVSDRGSSDYLTLELLAFLQKNRVPVRVLVSNHGSDFIRSCESLTKHSSELVDAGIILGAQKISFLGLQAAFNQENGCSPSRLDTLVSSVYKPSLRLLDYSLDDNGITLFTHAPVRFSVLEDLANALGVIYEDQDPKALAKTIDKMNSVFAKRLKANDLGDLLAIPEHTANELGLDGASLSKAEQKDWPFVHLIWNRWSEQKDSNEPEARPPFHNGYAIQYVHGHDPYIPQKQHHIINLDSELGKNSRPQDVSRKYLVLSISQPTYQEQHDPEKIQREFQERYKPEKSGMRRLGIGSLVMSIFFVVGMAIGLALSVSGAFTPFGFGILGGLALGGTIGGGFGIFGFLLGLSVAINTERPIIDTRVPTQPQPVGSSYAKVIGNLGVSQTESLTLDASATSKSAAAAEQEEVVGEKLPKRPAQPRNAPDSYASDSDEESEMGKPDIREDHQQAPKV